MKLRCTPVINKVAIIATHSVIWLCVQGSVLLAQSPRPVAPTTTGQIYLQLDRSVYKKGETIWFSAYLSTQNETPVGSTLQTELWRNDSLCMRMQYPVALGVTSGQFELPARCTTGWYYIRAFTEQTALTPFQTPLYIIGQEAPARSSTIATNDSLQLRFYPESGHLVAGIETVIAFKATDRFGLPKAVAGTIRNAQGQAITAFSTWHLGLGEFNLLPKPGQTYYAEWTEQGSVKRQPLGPVQASGTILSLINHPEGFLFELIGNQSDPLKKGHWLVGTKEGKEVFRLLLPQKRENIEGVLKTKTLSSGMLSVVVLDSLQTPLITRHVFINNKEYLRPILLDLDTLSVASKAINRWRLQWPDSLQGSISVAITDADRDGRDNRGSSILSQSLMGSRIANELFRPDWYFGTTQDSAEIGLDLLMLTSQDKSIQSNTTPALSEKENKKGYITVRGQAFLRGTRQPLANARLIVVLSAQRVRNNLFFTTTDKTGRFAIDSLLFFGPARLIFAEHRPQKKSRLLDIQLDKTSLAPLSLPYAITRPALATKDSLLQKTETPWLAKLDDNVGQAEGITLQEVTVTARAKSALEKLQEEYTSGAFETDAFVERVIDLVNNDEAETYANIVEYLRFRIPGLQVVDPDYSKSPPTPGQSGGFDPRNDPTKYRIFYRQMPTASSMGNPPMTIYLNEIEVDADVLVTIPAAEIALVKLFSTFAAATGGGAGGALAVYTKKADLLRAAKENTVTFTGYTPIKNFPRPDYEDEPWLREKPDGQITLFWRANLFLNEERNNLPIRFYNSDRTKRFRIVVEGWSVAGQPIYFEKIVE